jgi:hypothetical protein
VKSVTIDDISHDDTISQDTTMSRDMIRLLRAQHRIAPWSDIFEKETILVFHVFVEDGAIKTRLRGLTMDPLRGDIENTLAASLDPTFREVIMGDYNSYVQREVTKEELDGRRWPND